MIDASDDSSIMVPLHVIDTGLDAAYAMMAADEEREAEAQEWVEATVVDVADAAR